MAKQYDRAYYEARQQRTKYSADVVLDAVLAHAAPVHSAVDIGCGVGTWLAALRARGIADVQGVDGPWVDTDLLNIPVEQFKRVNLSLGEAVALGRRYDLAISLEVAEHLGKDRAEPFVETLTECADQVLFSAAIPGQGGSRHLNEQWQSYWAGLFARHGYLQYDCIRPRIWNDERMPYWYRQNTFFYVRRDTPAAAHVLRTLGAPIASGPVDVVHPRLFEKRARRKRRLSERLRTLFQ